MQIPDVMKAFHFLSVLTLFFTLSTSHAQKIKNYRIWVTLEHQELIKGTLYAANEDELIILVKDLSRRTVAPESIQFIKLRKEGNPGNGALIGAGSGLVVGAIVGYSVESGSGWEEVGAIGGAMLGAPIGTLTGLAIGSAKDKYVINGDLNTYKSLLPMLQKYAPQ